MKNLVYDPTFGSIRIDKHLFISSCDIFTCGKNVDIAAITVAEVVKNILSGPTFRHFVVYSLHEFQKICNNM